MERITGKYINNYGSRVVGDVEYWKSTVSAMHFVFLFMDDFAKSLTGEIALFLSPTEYITASIHS
ncbi:MAG TPA: hypothetical protein VF939_19415 [Puia sp.]